MLFIGVTIISLGAFIPAIFWLRAELIASGALDLLALPFSNIVVLTQYGSDFGLALLESLPTLQMTALLAPLLMLLWAMRRLSLIPR
jgi:hypothetical protein